MNRYKVTFEIEKAWEVDYVELVKAKTKHEAIEQVKKKVPKSFGHHVILLQQNTV